MNFKRRGLPESRFTKQRPVLEKSGGSVRLYLIEGNVCNPVIGSSNKEKGDWLIKSRPYYTHQNPCRPIIVLKESERHFRHISLCVPYPSTSMGSRPVNPSNPPTYHLLRPKFLSKTPPMTPAATATPLMMATPIRPSLVTLSSIRARRLAAWRFAGSFSKRASLYFLACA